MTTPDYDIILAGYGPVGTTAANLFGQLGIRTLVLERDDAVYRLPRAGTCDDESMRIWQSIHLSDLLMPKLLPQNILQFLDGAGKPFLEVRSTDFGYGFHVFILLYQPFIEKTLREGVDRFPCVEVRLGNEAESFSDSGEGVTVVVRDHGTDKVYEVTAKYLLGCDGGRSIVRHQIGAELIGKTFQQWLVVDVKIDDPSKYPSNLQFICDPKRPVVTYPMAFNHHRWQFMLKTGETQEQMEQLETVRALLAPWVDLGDVELIRKSVYIYHARIADKWTAGRVFLAGDAAHLTPPFGGTGMNSGIRDVSNLSWKMALVLRGHADPAILQSYQIERKPHVQRMTRMSVNFGRILQTESRTVAWIRNLFFRLLKFVPTIGRKVRSGEFRPEASFSGGLVATDRQQQSRAARGKLFIQPKVRTTDEESVLLDEVLGHGFAVLGLEVDPRCVITTESQAFWENLSTRFVRIIGATEQPGPEDGLAVVADLESKLAAWFDRFQVNLVVLRPDRYVFAVFNANTASSATQELRQSLFPDGQVS